MDIAMESIANADDERSKNDDRKKRKNDADPTNAKPNEHDDPEAWREQMCKDLHEHVRKQLKCSWERDGRCGVEACNEVTGRYVPYKNGPPEHDHIGYHSDVTGCCMAGSIPITVGQHTNTIVVCSPTCYKRARTLKKSSPTLFGEYGPIIRGMAFQSHGGSVLGSYSSNSNNACHY